MNLKEMRENKNLRQEDVAKILKVHRTTLIRIEQGVSSLKLEHLSILSELYDIKETDLLRSYNKLNKEEI